MDGFTGAVSKSKPGFSDGRKPGDCPRGKAGVSLTRTDNTKKSQFQKWSLPKVGSEKPNENYNHA